MLVWKMWWNVGVMVVAALSNFSVVRVSRTSDLFRSSDCLRTSDLFRSSRAWAKIGLGKMNCENSGEEEDGDIEIEQIG